VGSSADALPQMATYIGLITKGCIGSNARKYRSEHKKTAFESVANQFAKQSAPTICRSDHDATPCLTAGVALQNA
jgi:hypothetical protein